jgi:acyl-coenzyme A synthetase/AMP-(fatty) acid ligase
MLYERWQAVVRSRPREFALCDVPTGRRWTFGQLLAAGEAWQVGDAPVIFPRRTSVEFLLALLAAWRQGRVVCPLDGAQALHAVPAPPSGCVHLKSTSATTGAPRWIAFTAAQLAADAQNIVTTMGLKPEWPNFAVISLAHSYGFSNLILPLLLHGIPLILGGVPLPGSVRNAAASTPESSGGVTLPAVPALWRAWFETRSIPSNVRLAISAGAPLPLALEQAVFRDDGLKIHNFYGSSECGGIAYDASELPRSEDAFVGAALRNVMLGVADDGCLQVRGEAVGETYWPDPDAALERGRFQTADLAELRDGAVWLRGRLGDQINVAGRKLNPAVVEQALMEHPGMSGCVVFGVPSGDSHRGDDVIACVHLRHAFGILELRRFLSERLLAWQLPRDWWLVDELPANERGKISRASWRERYLQRHLRHRAAWIHG